MTAEGPRSRGLEPFRKITRRIYRSPGTELARRSQPEELPEMNLRTAKRILRTIINTHESTFTDVEDFLPERVGPYTTSQIRQAALVVTSNILSKYKDYADKNVNFTAVRGVPKKGFETETVIGINYPTGEDSSIQIVFDGKNQRHIEYTFALKEPVPTELLGKNEEYHKGVLYDKDVGYTDAYLDGANLYTLSANYREGEPITEEFQKLHRMTRWFSLTLLNFLKDKDSEVVLPENLDSFHPNRLTTIFSGRVKAMTS